MNSANFLYCKAKKKCLCILFIFSEKRNKKIYFFRFETFLGHKFLEMFRYFWLILSDNIYFLCVRLGYFNISIIFGNMNIYRKFYCGGDAWLVIFLLFISRSFFFGFWMFRDKLLFFFWWIAISLEVFETCVISGF